MQTTRTMSRYARWIALAALIPAAAACKKDSANQSPDAGARPICPGAGEPVAEPYPYYPSLDLQRIPFHVGSGPWGPRAPIQAPDPPVTTRQVTVHTAADLVTEALTPGTEITVGSDIGEHVVIFGDVFDVDIIVPPGVTVQQLTVGSAMPVSTTARVRIRGTTPGAHSGGLVGQLTFISADTTDVVIDGIDLNGDDGGAGGLLWYFAGETHRAAVVNVRGHASAAGSLGGGNDIVVAGCHLMTGARPREVNGYPEGWGMRAGDRLVVFDNRIDGTRYHRVRVHPGTPTPQYVWVANNVFVDRHEARILWVAALGGNGERFNGAWAQCNAVYAHSTCITPSFEARDADYSRLTHNDIYGSIDATLQGIIEPTDADADYLSDNRFAPWQEPPPWGALGDPTLTVPLPPEDPTAYDASLIHPPCPGP